MITNKDDMARVNFEGDGYCLVFLRALGFTKKIKKCCPRRNPKRGNGKKKGGKKLQKHD